LFWAFEANRNVSAFVWGSSHYCHSSFFHSTPVFLLTFAWPEEGEEGREERPVYPENI